MAPEPVTTERIYARLKAEILCGRYPPRAELVVAAIAEEFGVSVSPVRDSAQRLVGERLLEPHRAGGFLLPDITEKGLRDLYFWHGQLVRNALKANGWKTKHRHDGGLVPSEADLASPSAIASVAARLFRELASGSSNVEHVRAVIAAGERLHAVRIREAELMRNAADELQAVQGLTASGSGSDLIHAVWAYHRRRLRRTKSIVKAVNGTVL